MLGLAILMATLLAYPLWCMAGVTRVGHDLAGRKRVDAGDDNT